MNGIEELINKLCPDGVEFKKLGEIGLFYGGLTGKSKNDFTNGNAKFITYKNIYSNPALNTDIEERVLIKEGEKQNHVVYGDVLFTGSSETPDECGISSVITKHLDEKLYLNSFCFGFRLNDKSIFLPDFLKHLFRSQDLRIKIGKTASGVTRFNVSKSKMTKISIPIPPLEIQQEIVRILDNFTELTNELTNELTARKKQYEYYRDKLLTFDKDDDKVKWMKLGEVAEINTGKKPTIIFENNGEYEYINAGTTNSGFTDNFNSYGDVVTTPSRGQGGIGFIGYQRNKFWLGPLCYKIFSKAHSNSNKYLYYILSLNKNKILKLKREAGVPAINMSDLKSIRIPIPPIETQRRIVSILDRFDQLCNDLTSGLPAEIEARQKQYEYYRDKLLTFKEKKA